jgi:hypothetical protein
MISSSELKYYNDLIWWSYSTLTILPLFILTIHKICNPVHQHLYSDRNPFPHLIQDKIARAFLFYAPFYYFLDAAITIYRGNLIACNWAFLLHHLTSLIFLPILIKQTYYPWHCCAVPCMHALLLVFPEMSSLNYVYIIICIFYHYGINQEPFCKMKNYRILNFGTWILELFLVLLWAFGCKNTFESI